ncbi:MAG: alpha/beta hydrolase [Pseudomonadota bacterium]
MAKRVSIAFAVLAVLCIGAVFGAGEYLSSPAPRAVGEAPPELYATPLLIPYQGGRAAGWIARGAGSGAVLLLHGVRADRRQMQERALFLNRLGYSVLLIDLAAHGESTGKRITFGAREADGVRAALAYLRRNLRGERIGVIGSSLGGAALLLSKPVVDAVVLEAVYPTIEDAVANRLRMRGGAPAALLAPLLLHQLPLRTGVSLAALRPADAIAHLASPVLVAGGSSDLHTGADETRRLFAAARGPKELWIVKGAAHVDFHAFAKAEYEQKVGAFLARHLRP